MTAPAYPWSFLTADLPGTGGRIRVRPEDFVVEEVPLYRPSGRGTHCYLWVEKEGMGTFEAVTKLARALGRRVDAVGYAGLKDAGAVTRQYLSIEHTDAEAVRRLDLPGIRILHAAMHRNKLHLGHLAGNRFRVRIREPFPGALSRAQAVMERLAARGVPNYFGPQRFGDYGTTHLLGRHLLAGQWRAFVDTLVLSPAEGEAYAPVAEAYRAGDYAAALEAVGRTRKYERRVLSVLARTGGRFEKAVRSIEKRMLRFYLSAFQSYHFNRYLERRLDRIDTLEAGEIAVLHRNGAAFRVEDPAREEDRLAAFEISPSGPLFGSRMLRAEGEAGRMEAEILKETGVAIDEMEGRCGIRLRGRRRALRVPLRDWSVEEDESGLMVAFLLPPGSYATVVLREITKCAHEETR